MLGLLAGLGTIVLCAKLAAGDSDLLVGEPAWASVPEGSPSDTALQVNATTQVWRNDVKPGVAGPTPVCRWEAGQANAGHGSCRTDIAWLHSAIGIERSLFSDVIANYVLRFHLHGACYRSTRVRSQAQPIAVRWLGKHRTGRCCFKVYNQ